MEQIKKETTNIYGKTKLPIFSIFVFVTVLYHTHSFRVHFKSLFLKMTDFLTTITGQNLRLRENTSVNRVGLYGYS